MTEKDYLKKYDIKVVILSRGRYNTITTHKLLPSYIEVVVPDDEIDLYKEVLENPLIPIPHELEGLGAVRNWCLKNFEEETIIMIDDDIVNCYYLADLKARRIDDGQELLQILINTAVMAKDMGVHCFGYSQTDIRKFNGTEPFKLNSWVGCVVGVIGRKYEFRNDKFKVDIDFCLQNLLVDRRLFIDNRYYFIQKRDCNVGGNSKYRTQEAFNKSVESLKEKWGDYVKVSKRHESNIQIKLNVKRRQSVEYEK